MSSKAARPPLNSSSTSPSPNHTNLVARCLILFQKCNIRYMNLPVFLTLLLWPMQVSLVGRAVTRCYPMACNSVVWLGSIGSIAHCWKCHFPPPLPTLPQQVNVTWISTPKHIFVYKTFIIAILLCLLKTNVYHSWVGTWPLYNKQAAKQSPRTVEVEKFQKRFKMEAIGFYRAIGLLHPSRLVPLGRIWS